MSDESTAIMAIDRAIEAARARKSARDGTAGARATPEAPKEPNAPKRPRLTDEEKAARKAARDAERAAKRAEREAARAARRAAREAERRTPHMRKVEKAASRLPPLSAEAEVAFNDITANFSAAMVSAIAAHLTHFNRVKATERALGRTFNAGDVVRIVGGDPRFVGQVGEVFKAQRIRCYVTVPGAKRPVYLFTSDIELVEAAPVAKTA